MIITRQVIQDDDDDNDDDDDDDDNDDGGGVYKSLPLFSLVLPLKFSVETIYVYSSAHLDLYMYTYILFF